MKQNNMKRHLIILLGSSLFYLFWWEFRYKNYGKKRHENNTKAQEP